MSPKRGRPSKYQTGAERIHAFRERQQKNKSRIDVYIDTQVEKRLDKLAKAWDCPRGAMIHRLLLETHDKYRNV